MLNLKSNVYRNEWLELVFAGRNKLYGAYELRQGYSSRLVKALLLSVSLFVSVITGPFLYNRFVTTAGTVVSDKPLLKTDERIVYMVPKTQPRKTGSPTVRPSMVKQKTIIYTTFKPVPPEQVTVEVPAQAQLQNVVISNQAMLGTDVVAGANAAISGNDQGTGNAEDSGAASNKPFITVQQMPEFPGGMEAFGKYLSKSLRYPSQAQDAGIQGRVTVSFIVESNGSLTDIHVLRGIGGGCDEEAMRVVRKSLTWRPGEQNGRKVRVQYNIPIVFNLGD